MSPTPDSPTSNGSSPRPSPRSGDGPNSPRPHRAARGPPSQWAHVVRSIEPESGAAAVALSPAAAQSPEPALDHDLPKPLESDAVAEASVPEASDGCGGNGDAQAWKPAWNKLSNGAVEVGPVMGASWPPLSESARASPRSSSESLKSLADGSVSPSPSPVITSSPKKQTTNNQNHNLTPNTAFPARQKSMKRFGVTTQPSSETPPNASEKSPAAVLDSPHRESAHKNSNWEPGSRPHAGNEYPRPRRGGGGQQPRGDGFYNNSYGNWRDQERLNYEWNPNRNFSGRGDGHIQQQPRVMARNFMRPPPLTRPFMAPPPVRTLGSPLGFQEMPSPGYFPSPVPDSFRGMPFVVPAPVFIPQPDPHLRTMLIKQIEYYFSPENLCKDIFLRQNMDEHGWVSISLIANFNRVKHLTHDIQFILDAVRTSTVVELMGDKIRKRGDWERWRLASGTKTSNVLVGQMQNLGLEEGMMMHSSMKGPSANTLNEGAVSRSSSGDLNSASQVSVPGGTANREGMNQATVQVG